MVHRIKIIFPCLALACSLTLKGQNHFLDSLLTLLKTEKEDTLKVKTLNQVAWQYNRVSDYENALNFSRLGKALGEKLNYRKGIAISFSVIGSVYYHRGNYPEALKNHFSSLKIREMIGDKKGIADSYNNIGNVYDDQGNFSEALKNYRGALPLYEAMGNRLSLAGTYNNIGNIYNDMGKYPEALNNYLEALNIRVKIEDEQGLADSYLGIGIVYKNQGNYDDALRNSFKSLHAYEKLGNKERIILSNTTIGSVLLKQKKYAEATNYFISGLHLSMETGDKEGKKESFMGLAVIDSVKGDYQSAYTDYNKYIIYRDSLINEDNTKKTVQSQMQYDFDKKQTADSIKNAELVNQENLKHEHEIKQQKLYTYGGIFGFLLMLVVAGVSFNAYREKQKANEIISGQKQLVEEKQKEILDSIHYASRIQRSLLPTEKQIEKSLKRLRP